MAVQTVLEAYGDNIIGLGGGGTSSGGHSIIDAEGNTMPQESAMQFADARVEDDDTNGKTVVHVTQEPMTVSEFNSAADLPSGIYPLNGGEVLDDSMIMHDSTHTTRQAINDINDSLVVVSTTMPDLNTQKYINLPTGFTRSNTYIVSIMGDYGNGTYNMQTRDTFACDMLTTNNVDQLVLWHNKESIMVGIPVRILLQKHQ